MKRSASTNLVSSISFELFVIGVLNKYGDVTDVRGDGGVVVHHGDGCLLGPHLQESLGHLKKHRARVTTEQTCTFHFVVPSFPGPHQNCNRLW